MRDYGLSLQAVKTAVETMGRALQLTREDFRALTGKEPPVFPTDTSYHFQYQSLHLRTSIEYRVRAGYGDYLDVLKMFGWDILWTSGPLSPRKNSSAGASSTISRKSESS